jgi:20S proteasome alpha/beta subunit
MAEVTMSGGTRVFGTSLIIAGFSEYDKNPYIYYIDNGGSFFGAKAYATGQDQEAIINFFREKYKKPITEDGAKRLVQDAINNSITDPNKKITQTDIEYLLVTNNEEDF